MRAETPWWLARASSVSAATVALACALLAATPVPAQQAEGASSLPETEIRAVLADVLAESAYQRDLPDTLPEEPEPESRPVRLEGTSIPAGVFYVFVAVAAVAFGLYIGNEAPFLLRRWRRRSEDDALAPQGLAGDGDDPFRTPAGLDRADALAAAGDHTGAVRLLLLTVFDTLAVRAGDSIPPALTSREVLQRAGLSGDGRADVLAILTTEEESYFGGYPIDRTAYDRCRQHFLSFVHGLSGGAGGRAARDANGAPA